MGAIVRKMNKVGLGGWCVRVHEWSRLYIQYAVAFLMLQVPPTSCGCVEQQMNSLSFFLSSRDQDYSLHLDEVKTK